jgi:phenylalanyl-tRNA synthetase alpha chain
LRQTNSYETLFAPALCDVLSGRRSIDFLGLKDLRFKPAYNPYTEPSLEIFAFHPHLDKWVEIGNSGMFRPEMLEAMGLPKDVKVHGWGLSLERYLVPLSVGARDTDVGRPTMIMTGCANIRELLGHKCSIEWIESQPAVRLDQATAA